LTAARERAHGTQIMSFEHVAARLAGGLARPIDGDALRSALQIILPNTALGELDGIKALPGTPSAAAETLQKAWLAGIDLSARAGDHRRLASMAEMERRALALLPRAMLRPSELIEQAMRRLAHAPRLLGSVDVVGMTELSPCWRPLLHALATRLPVRWIAGPRSVPAWLDEEAIEIVRGSAGEPGIEVVSNATPYHEALESMRWARALIASGSAEPHEIAIASTVTAEYDDFFLALRAEADFDLHFVHGINVTATRDGQSAAALADILLRGLSRTRVRRLTTLLSGERGPLKDIPPQWTRILPADAPLATAEAWYRLLGRLTPADWPEQSDHGETLRGVIGLLDRGIAAAGEIGETLLGGRPRSIWRKALLTGPAASLDLTLAELRQEDGLEAGVSVAWMPASELAASPRRFARLLGLNSLRWPRLGSEDRLLPDHIIPGPLLDPLPLAAADRRDFDTIVRTTDAELVLSLARRDGGSRRLGRSPLLHDRPEARYVRRNAAPEHAMSECDRLLARPHEFAVGSQCASALRCWHDWHRAEITAHDGLIRSGHPLLAAILEQSHSASSLKRLLRNPLGYLWRYGLRWSAPSVAADPLAVDSQDFGTLVHDILNRALRLLEATGSASTAQPVAVSAAVEAAAAEVAERWESDHAVPPFLIWEETLHEMRQAAQYALTYVGEVQPGLRRFGEVPFGGEQRSAEEVATPWDAAASVEIPGTGLEILGYIDRLDLSSDGRRATVYDYKTGEPPKQPFGLNGGRELQRCLYAFAVKALLPPVVTVDASLVYVRQKVTLALDDPEGTLAELSTYLKRARDSLGEGRCLPGPDAGDDFDELSFALPANAAKGYRARKLAAARERLADAALVWEAL
jgi:RecB family exonuclease